MQTKVGRALLVSEKPNRRDLHRRFACQISWARQSPECALIHERAGSRDVRALIARKRLGSTAHL
jgi:hypothetical protein